MPDPERVKGLLPGLMSGLGVSAPMQSARLFSRWEQIVGADVAGRSRPVSLKGGLLRIKTDSAIWAAEFRYLAPEVIRRVNAELGGQLVKEIKVWVDPGKGAEKRSDWGPSRVPQEPSKPPPEAPSAKAVQQAEEMVSTIHDERLSEAVKKALLAAKMRRRGGA